MAWQIELLVLVIPVEESMVDIVVVGDESVESEAWVEVLSMLLPKRIDSCCLTTSRIILLCKYSP